MWVCTKRSIWQKKMTFRTDFLGNTNFGAEFKSTQSTQKYVKERQRVAE
jgi:hypothetical protein